MFWNHSPLIAPKIALQKLSPASFFIAFILKNAFENFYNFLFLFRLPNGFF
ncbi:hypothetical protein OUG_1001 [Helicobacter pylori R32b]|nr:hypothetical protein OUG_1001 [Helicobacter pylori R32b]